jgi:hypothetical protein
MKALARLAIPALALLLVPSLASAASLTTLFAANNSGSVGGAVYFDVTVGSTELIVTGFETNTEETTPFGWEVLLTPGTSVGNELTPALWTSVATGSGVGAGLNVPSIVTLDNVFSLEANTSYGMMLILTGAGHDYTNGSDSFSNADLTLDLGSASNTPFDIPPGGFFEPRTWNGTIIYEPIPEPSAVALFGIGALVVGAATRRRSN